MDQHRDNPPANQLPSSVPEDKLVEAVRKSGYPLQTVVARELSSHFTVVEEWGYRDKTEKVHRTLDVYCFRHLDSTGLTAPRLHLLVECKRSDVPYVFFGPGVNRLPKDFPEIFGCGSFMLTVPQGSQDASAADFFCANEFPFVSPGPTIATAFARAERKKHGFELSGTVPFNQVVLRLASAMEQVRGVFGGGGTAGSPMIVLAICVVDGPMVVASGTPEEPHLLTDPWVRIIHQEAFQDIRQWHWRHYTVDFIHRAFLRTYVEDHALPFAEALAARILQYRTATPTGKRNVRTRDKSWAEFIGR